MLSRSFVRCQCDCQVVLSLLLSAADDVELSQAVQHRNIDTLFSDIEQRSATAKCPGDAVSIPERGGADLDQKEANCSLCNNDVVCLHGCGDLGNRASARGGAVCLPGRDGLI